MNLMFKNAILWITLYCLLATSDVVAALVDCGDTATVGVPESECVVLVALYDATNGDFWIDSSNWKTDVPVASWYGVRVVAGHVVELALFDNNLAGVLPASLGNLPYLEELFLYRNQLTGTLPSELGNLTALKNLLLGANQLNGQIPPELGNLSNLLDMTLKDNRLTGSIPPQLGQLGKLQNIDLSTNELSGSIPAELGSLSFLQGMVFTRNRLDGQLPDALGDLAALRVLDLDDNRLSGFIPKTLGKLNNLETLELGMNQLTGPIPAELGGLAMLRGLDLYENFLTGILPPELGNITTLVDMQVHGNRLTGPIPDSFAVLTGLHTFLVNHNQLDADASGDALISPALLAWYGNITDRDISHQSPPASPGISLHPVTGLIVDEAGSSASFSLVLDTQPASDVTVMLVSSDTTEGVVSPGAMAFTPENWFVWQSAMLTGVNDNVVDGNQGYTIGLAVGSSDTDYDGIATDTVSAITVDDDQAGITVYPINGLVTTEAGGTDIFQVLLNTQPVADVAINLHSSDVSEGVIDSATLLFTPGNWNAARTVTVTGVNDDEFDGDRVYSIVLDKAVSTDGLYHDFDPDDVSVTNMDSESNPAGAGVTVAPTTGLETTESGATASFTVVLDTRPGAVVNIDLGSSDASEGVVSPANLVFTPDNWAVAKTVTITGVDDPQIDGDQAYVIVVAQPLSADDSYHLKFGPVNVAVINIDDDTSQNQPGISITPAGGLLTTENETTVNFSVVLKTEPTADVTIGFSSSDPGEGTVSPASLVFTPLNWETVQMGTVTGVADGIVDGNQPYTIVTTSSSADAVYAAIDPLDIAVSNEDINAISVVVSPETGLRTSESGDVDNFTVKLGSRPMDDVTLALRSSDENEGTVNPTALVFSATSWNTLQTVTVTGQEDLDLDGDQPYTVITDPASSNDAQYEGLDPVDVSVINQDNDPEPSCSSPPADVELRAGFMPGTYLCIGDNSIRSQARTDPSPDIAIESGADVHFRAPAVEFRSGFRVETGASLEVQAP